MVGQAGLGLCLPDAPLLRIPLILILLIVDTRQTVPVFIIITLLVIDFDVALWLGYASFVWLELPAELLLESGVWCIGI